MKRFGPRLLPLAALTAFIQAASLYADPFMFQFVNVFSGSAPASTNKPWIDAVFQDVAPGTVRLTVSNLTLSGAENVDQLYLNLRTNLSPLSLKFTSVGGSGGFQNPSVKTGVNLFQADGDGKYDILFSFNNTGNTKKQFNGGEYMVYDISGIAGLTVADFEYFSAPAGGAGPFLSAVHVQRIASGRSGWIAPDNITPFVPIPEPSSGLLLATALALGLALHSACRCAPIRARVRPPSIRMKKAKRCDSCATES